VAIDLINGIIVGWSDYPFGGEGPAAGRWRYSSENAYVTAAIIDIAIWGILFYVSFRVAQRSKTWLASLLFSISCAIFYIGVYFLSP